MRLPAASIVELIIRLVPVIFSTLKPKRFRKPQHTGEKTTPRRREASGAGE